MNLQDQKKVTEIILNNIPDTGTISLTDLKKLIDAKVKVMNWEDVQNILAYLQVTGSIQKIGVLDVKYAAAEVRRIHP
jgi:hypothetical protein